MMQMSIQSSFKMIAEKMEGIEQRLVKSDVELKCLTNERQNEKAGVQDEDVRNRNHFLQLQEAIAQQQEKLLSFVQKSTLDINSAQKNMIREPQRNLVVGKIIEEIKFEVAPETRKDEKSVPIPLAETQNQNAQFFK